MAILVLHRFVGCGKAARLVVGRCFSFIVWPLCVRILGLGVAAQRPRLVVCWGRYWMHKSGERSSKPCPLDRQ